MYRYLSVSVLIDFASDIVQTAVKIGSFYHSLWKVIQGDIL